MWQQSWRGCGASTDKYEPRRSLRRFPFRFANQDATKIVEVRQRRSLGNVTIMQIFPDARELLSNLVYERCDQAASSSIWTITASRCAPKAIRMRVAGANAFEASDVAQDQREGAVFREDVRRSGERWTADGALNDTRSAHALFRSTMLKPMSTTRCSTVLFWALSTMNCAAVRPS